MNRLPRVAAVAVLAVALCVCAHAGASTVPTARLDVARVFNPQSESLLATLLTPPRDFSPFFVAVFNVYVPSDVPAPAVRVNVARSVNVTGITPMQTFTAPPAVAYSVPAPKPAPLAAKPSHVEVASMASPSVAPPNFDSVPTVHFGSYAAYTPAVQAMSANVEVPVRVGGVHFSGLVSGSQAQTTHTDAFREVQFCGTTDEGSACPYLHESSASSLVAATNFSLRTWDRNVQLQLGGGVEHLSNSDAAIFPYVPLDPDETLDAASLNANVPGNSMLYYPGVSDLVKHTINAQLAVPITQRVTLGLQYDTSHYQGDYGSPVAQGLVQGVDARKDTYLGNVTYQLPYTNSAITLSTRLYRYQDGFTQNFNLTQTRTDLNFTVKF